MLRTEKVGLRVGKRCPSPPACEHCKEDLAQGHLTAHLCRLPEQEGPGWIRGLQNVCSGVRLCSNKTVRGGSLWKRDESSLEQTEAGAVAGGQGVGRPFPAPLPPPPRCGRQGSLGTELGPGLTPRYSGG